MINKKMCERADKEIFDDLKEVIYGGRNNVVSYYKGDLKRGEYIILNCKDIEKIVNLFRESLRGK